MIGGASQTLGYSPTARLARRSRQGLLSRLPDGGRRLDAYHIGQSELGEGSAKWRAVSVAGVCQYHAYGKLLLQRFADLLQRNLRLGLELNPLRNAGPLAPLRIPAPHLR